MTWSNLAHAVVQALQCCNAGPNTDPLRDGFQATSLDSDEGLLHTSKDNKENVDPEKDFQVPV
ncbi:TPA: hypothetical protein ACH3X1_011728 [Trebouxia sp. C0004]